MRFMAALLATTCLGSALFAGNLEQPVETPIVDTPAETLNWTGGYVGAQIETFFSAETTTTTSTEDLDGESFGLFAGYRYDFGSYVLGGEIDYLKGEVQNLNGSFDTTLIRGAAEVGYDLGNFLPYAVLGFARFTDEDSNSDADGLFYGLGLDYLISDNWMLGAELLVHDLEADGVDINAPTFGVNAAYRF